MQPPWGGRSWHSAKVPAESTFGLVTEMARQATVILYIVLLAAIVVGVDFLFLRNRFWERLMVNIGIVLVFAVFYLRFLKHP
jgi:hypothetical protein